MRYKALAAASLALLLLLPPVSRAAVPTERIAQWWQYDPKMWRHGFSQHPVLAAEHRAWHDHHPDAGHTKHVAYHRELTRKHRRMHFHEAADAEAGQATWYDASGAVGACGEVLRGMYVAHKTWPCGSLVSVRINGRYVFVKVLDRGPYGDGRIVDLSEKAFSKLADPSVGVLDVRATRLKP
jgi:rare lipoprotein A